MQSRQMKIHLKNTDVYKIIPNVFEDLEVPVKEINIYSFKKDKKEIL